MTNERNNASATLDLPDLDLLISAAGRQVVFNRALCGFRASSCNLAHILGFLLGLLVVGRSCWALFVLFAAFLELLLHLLDALLSREPGGCCCAGLVLRPGVTGVAARS